jgi:serpin B
MGNARKRFMACLGGAGCLLWLAPGCRNPFAEWTPAGPPPEVVRAQKENRPVNAGLRYADNGFGIALFRELAKRDVDQNLFISPVSVALALQMTYNGAKGDTQQAMAKAMELKGLSLEEINKANAALLASLSKPTRVPPPPPEQETTLTIANSLWLDRNRPLKPEFVQRNRDFYGAEIGDLAGAPNSVNAWVRQKTNGKIRDIVQKGDLDNVAALLVNAVYFKGIWTKPFIETLTKNEPFTRADGRRQTCRMMHASDHYAYYEGDGVQAVRLPYVGTTEMVIVLPDTKTPLAKLIEGLTMDRWRKWMTALQVRKGDLALPRFQFEYGADLNEPLSELGMGAAFDPGRADFSGMVEGNRVWISRVRHKTFVSTDERGTEAAAATMVAMTLSAIIDEGKPFRMVVDRPFLCAIRDNETGALLFLGAVADPK